MPYLLEDLVVDRVDLVEEGANSAAFIEVFKRKERNELMDFSEILSKMKPEHASVIQQELDNSNAELKKAREELDSATATITEQAGKLTEVNDALAKAKEELAKSEDCTCDGEADEEGMCKACGKPKKKSTGFDETEVLKSMPEGARAEFLKMRAQKEAAEEQVRKAAEEKAEAEAIAKAATLKSLPVEQDTLVNILKSCDQSVVDVLSTVAAAIDGVVLKEVGKNTKEPLAKSAWDKIEAKADEIVTRDTVTKQRAIATAITENPALYKEYLEGGAN